jgi:hypothetical protein
MWILHRSPFAAVAVVATLLAVDAHAESLSNIIAGNTAADELTHIHEVGAESYTEELWRDSPRWDMFLSRIDSGQREWLRVAQAIKPAADGAVAEQLLTSIAEALIENPPDVLRLLSPEGGVSTWRITTVCGGPIPAPGKAWLTTYKAKALQAVATVREPDLIEKKRQCLRALHGIDLSKPADAYD